MTRGEYGYGVCADCKNAVALDSNYEPDESCQKCRKGGDPTDQVIESFAREDSDLPAGWNQDSIDLWYGFGDDDEEPPDEEADYYDRKRDEDMDNEKSTEADVEAMLEDLWLENEGDENGGRGGNVYTVEDIALRHGVSVDYVRDIMDRNDVNESYDDDLEPNEHRDELFPPKKKRKPKGTEFQFQDETQVGHYGAYPDSEQMSQDIDKLTQLLVELQNELTQAEEIPKGNIQNQIEDVETQLKQLQNDFDNIADYGFYDPTTMEALQKKFSMCNDCMSSALEKLSKEARHRHEWVAKGTDDEGWVECKICGIDQEDVETDPDLDTEWGESKAIEDADSSIAPQIDYTEPTYDDLDDRLKGVTQADTADSLSNFGVDLTFPKYNDNSDTTNLGYLEKAIFNESQMAETIYEEYYNSIAPMFATYDTWDKYAKDSGLSQQETVEIWQQNNEGVGGEPDFSFERRS